MLSCPAHREPWLNQNNPGMPEADPVPFQLHF
nr:MAG TPA: hypothetical protein [Caudoviricetes sp.]